MDLTDTQTKEVLFQELVEDSVSSSPTETLKIATVEAEVENGTTNQPEKITNESGAEKTNLKSEKSEAKSNVSEARYEESLKQKELESDPIELLKIEGALKQGSSKINDQSPGM